MTTPAGRHVATVADKETIAPARSVPVRAQFVRFVLASGLAALANFGSRIGFSCFFGYATAIVLAFGVGLICGFVLNRTLVFSPSRNSLRLQLGWFLAINLLGLGITLSVSMAFARIILPALGVHAYAEAIAHALGIAAPIASSYLGHKYLTFRAH